ncbi:Histidine--tRNA ligase [Dendrobium catenatum]|uniref:histidine--tRNA ligase n=1 Tax=Dendrobium catenatum TaxID=906689 RepID=A0A2I0WES1_9ASPA|nr:Histidine--tRNA ligase [Dendrobium catenatum]
MSIASSIEHIIPRCYLSLKPPASLPRALPLLRAHRRLFFRPLSSPVAASVDSTATKDNARPPSTDDDTSVSVASERSLVDVNPPRGTRDFPPEDMRLRNWLFNNFREVSRLLSFEEVDFPVLESEALFIRKGGEEITQQAEAELIHAIVLLFGRLGITYSDVGIRISSRKVLQAVLQLHSIPEHLFAEVCVIVDKMGKVSRDVIENELMTAGVSIEAVKGIIEVLSLKSLSKLEEVLGSEDEAVTDLKSLFLLAEHYGYIQWINFDASVVRGLAYYTGIVFEAFDREGKLRAICGGGRYDRLFSTFGSDDIPACGFGFGDAVIVELLKEKGLLPDLNRQVDDIVFLLDEELEGPALKIVSSLRQTGRSVDLIQDKRLKWVFKHAERINAERLILVGNSEWQRGLVRVKILATRDEFEVKMDELTAPS